jgi:hypothetical protein
VFNHVTLPVGKAAEGDEIQCPIGHDECKLGTVNVSLERVPYASAKSSRGFPIGSLVASGSKPVTVRFALCGCACFQDKCIDSFAFAKVEEIDLI